ncbi:MAG: MFS transporter, partial [Candidatus Moraniibacteriota bacterium]
MQAVFALYVKDVFGFNAQTTGLIFTGMGIFMILNQTILLDRFWLKRFKEQDLEIWLFLLFALGYIFLGVPILFIFFLGLLINMMARSVLRIVISSQVAGIAGAEKRGEIMGIMASILALSNVGGPILAGALYEFKNFIPFLVSALMLLLAFGVMKFCCNRANPTVFNEAIANESREAL